MALPPEIEPENKDWTFVVVDGCAECGFDPTTVTPAGVGARLRATIPRWAAALGRPSAAERPGPTRQRIPVPRRVLRPVLPA